MITNKEVELTKLSPTKKDFYQIWNELLETAGKISERWDPSSTNESDPGIVLLKVLTAIADKLNYNIDKNILEAFMPSAAQEESMRKLCEMMGYNIKYYQSATTDVTVSYIGQKDANGNIATISEDSTDGSATAWSGDPIIIPQFSVVKNNDEDVNYFTLEPITFYDNVTTATVKCLEGQLVACEEDSDNIISIKHLDDNNRYYLPETQIAENGFFVYNINDSSLSDRWEQVDNLNIQQLKKACYKFGYDSVKNLPYLQFPDDISAIIEDGLLIYYTRTNGINGNISQQTLSQIEVPTSTSTTEEGEISQNPWDYFTKEDFTAINYSATTNGKNKESINQAYNNYKKTIGTFDTLVTCRDYMNKIYQLVSEDDGTTPLVSNIIATDLRTDLNKSYTLCSFNEYGISYENVPIKENGQDLISHFDLILYPFMYTSLPTIKEYKKSYTYSSLEYNHILNGVTKNKTLSHNIILPDTNEIACIKNYYTIKADIITTKKVNTVEEASILGNVYAAIYNEFNMRNLDFSEELSLDTIIDCIKNADNRIKMVNCSISDIKTRLALVNNDGEFDYTDKKDLYLKLIARNILAGRVPLFKYNTEFSTDFAEKEYSTDGMYEDKDSSIAIEGELYNNLPDKVIKLEPACTKKVSDVLTTNEIIQFRAPNFKTTFTYPAYVNYYAHIKVAGDPAIPADFRSVADIFSNNGVLLNNIREFFDKQGLLDGPVDPEENLDKYAPFIWSDIENQRYYINLNENHRFGAFYRFITSHIKCTGTETTVNYNYYSETGTLEDTEFPIKNIYREGSFDTSKPTGGALVTENGIKYQTVTQYLPVTSNDKPQAAQYFLQVPTFENDGKIKYDGLGQNATEGGIKANSEYRLGENEYIWLNYTENEQEVNKKYKAGTVIRPNFSLMDSNWAHTNLKYSWTKTNNKISGAKSLEARSDLGNDGYFSLGAQEQLEIRDIAQVTINEQAYIYWNLVGENIESLYSRLRENNNTSGKYTYTLGSDEYVYWADKNKTSFAWYGPGTELEIAEPRIIKNLINTKISVEDALTYGISKIPWILVNFTSSNSLTITEYQYINLTEFDEIHDITFIDEDINREVLEAGEEYEVLDATYIIKSSADDTGKQENLPILGGDIEQHWKVSTKLNINVGPDTTQTLNEGDQVRIYAPGDTKDTALVLKPVYKEENSNKQIIPLSFKANYKLQTSNSAIDTDYKFIDEDGEEAELTPFKIIVFESDDTVSQRNLYNLENSYTKAVASDLFYIDPSTNEEVADPIKLHIKVKEEEFGLMMFYVSGIDKDIAQETNYNAAYLQTDKSLKIYTKDSWWGDWQDNNKYYLKPGINIVKFEEPTDIELFGDTEATTLDEQPVHLHKATIVFDKLSLIDISDDENGINIETLGLAKIEANSDEILDQINNLLDGQTKQFYFNCPINNDVAININKDETLLDYNIWYDVNNINNQFVISELDSSTFKDNINIIKSSKL